MFSCSTSGWSRSASDEQQRATRQVGGIVLASSGCQDRMPSNAARWARSTSGMRTMSSTDGGECRRTDEPCGSVPSIHRRHGTSPATENEGVSHAARGRHRGAEQSLAQELSCTPPSPPDWRTPEPMAPPAWCRWGSTGTVHSSSSALRQPRRRFERWQRTRRWR